MTREEFLKTYWRYYCTLERKFIDTIEYVELATTNYCTYSNEFAHLLLAIGAELDNIFKVYCKFNLEGEKTICDYASYIKTKYSKIKEQKIKIPEYNITIIPFEKWNYRHPSRSLRWWKAFINIKHCRGNHAKEATLENVINILGALYLLEMKCLKEIAEETNDYDIPNEESKLFKLEGWQFVYKKLSSENVLAKNGEVVLDAGGA